MATKSEKSKAVTLSSPANRKAAGVAIRKMLAQRGENDLSMAGSWIHFCDVAKIGDKPAAVSTADWNASIRATASDIAAHAGLTRKDNASIVSRMTTVLKCSPASLRELASKYGKGYGEKVLTYAASRIAKGKSVNEAIRETRAHYAPKESVTLSPLARVKKAVGTYAKFARKDGGLAHIDRARAMCKALGLTYDKVSKA